MEPDITPFDWHRMLIGETPMLFMLEIVLRVVLIYLFAISMLHVLGKRGQRTLTPLEYLVIIALGSAVGDGMMYPGVPILAACVVITALMLMTELLSQLKMRISWIGKFIDTRPAVLVEDGALVTANMRSEGLNEVEVLGMLRQAGVENLGEVRYAFLEVTGALSVFRVSPGHERPGRPLVPPDDLRYGRDRS